MLVVICTDNAVESPFVLEEICSFARLGRKIVPVDVDGAFAKLRNCKDVWDAVGNAPREPENQEAIRSGWPSENVLDEIVNSIAFSTQNSRLKTAVWSTGVFVLIGITGALLYSSFIVRSANKAAETAKIQARTQHEIAVIEQIANRSTRVRGQGPNTLLKSFSDAIEAGNRAVSLGIQNDVVDAALRNSLSILPRGLGLTPIPEAVMKDNQYLHYAAFSPDGRHLAILTDNGGHGEELKLRQVADGQQIRSIKCNDCKGIALSNDLNRIATAVGSAVHVTELRSNRTWELRFENDLFLTAIALSPDGKHLVIGLGEETQIPAQGGYVIEGAAELWDVDRNRRVAELFTKFQYAPSAISFSPDGRHLVVGVGRTAMTWEFSGKRKVKGADGIPVESAFMDQERPVCGVAISDGGDHLAISDCGVTEGASDKQTVTVFTRVHGRSFMESALVPLQRPIHALAIAPESRLLTLSEVQARADIHNWLEAWTVEGMQESLRKSDLGHVSSLAFDSKQTLVLKATCTNESNEEVIRSWDIPEGKEEKTDGDFAPKQTTPRQERQKRQYRIRVEETGTLSIFDVQLNRSFEVPETKIDTSNISNPHPRYKLSTDQRYMAILLQFGEKDEGSDELHSVMLWDTGDHRTIKLIEVRGWIETYRFSASSKYLAVGDDKGVLQLLNLKTAAMHFVHHYGIVSSVAFSKDERYLASGDNSGLVLVSEAETGLELARLQQWGVVHIIIFSPDSNYLAAVANDKDDVEDTNFPRDRIYVWSLDSKDLLEEICHRLKAFPPVSDHCEK